MLRFLALLILLLGSSLAQSLLSLAPPGAVAGVSLGNLSNSRYLKGIAADWKESGMEALLKGEVRKEAGSDADLVGTFAGGAAVALYPDGFFLIARPNAAAMNLIRKNTKGLKPQAGWMVGGDKDALTGFSRDLVFIATPRIARLFLQNKRGLQAPISGDFLIWGAPPQNLIQSLQLPPRTNGAARVIRRFSFALKLTEGGYTSETRLEVNPAPDAAFASFFLPQGQPYDAGELPQGLSVSTGILDLAKLSRYLSAIAQELGAKVNLDLSAFGSRYATVNVQGPPPAPDGRSSDVLGHLLVYLEVKDPATAEANLLGLLQNLAAFATPQGQGGFKVLPPQGEFKAVQLGSIGKLYYKVEATRMVIATSTSALAAANGPTWKTDPNYQKFRVRIPANAVGYSFNDGGAALSMSAAQIGEMLPQTIGNQADAKFSRDLAKSLSNFMGRLAQRFGSGLSYSTVEGNTLIGRGFYEVRW
ncbi:hypothetical protein [Meiothermus granaticius]|uniref:DUF3352 domain-containing protein n=1 Tax=Meiothermus granaticius NBRC 107808 TaxID=1227551 RepID=A0A399FC48_9DEIN|nr:hypothetical protein [Meiothermus granaticius]RIH93286.1 hypothetical protein Mgrana_00729 [Meiothermus granaticius NBRC 107808]GEM85907.1 hypothetical protein MGR01S_05320 [Meiothermus granaticius NBRC 107808]